MLAPASQRWVAPFAALLIAGLVIAACGGGGATPTSQPAAATPPLSPSPVPTASPVPTPQPATATPTPSLPAAGLAAVTERLTGFDWVRNKPDWRVPPQRGGTHSYGFVSPPASLDPVLNRSFTVMTHATVVYNQLVRCAPAPLVKAADTGLCQPFPDLATAWSQSTDGLVWTFKLEKNARWQNIPPDSFGYDEKLKPLYGRQLQASDVVHTVSYWQGKLTRPDGKPQGTPAGGPWASFDSAAALDASTVQIKTKVVDPFVPFELADFQSRIVPPEVFNLDGDYTKRMVGTGAFYLARFDRGVGSEFNASPTFWRNGADGKPLPYIDKHVFTVLSDTLARSAIVTGQIDSAQSVGVNTRADADTLAKDCPTCQIGLTYSAWGVFAIGFKTEGPGAVFADARARLAVAKAIDWDAFIKNVHQGNAIMAPATNATPLIFDQLPALPLFVQAIRAAGVPDDENPYVFNPALARKIWADSGRAPGEKIKLAYTPLYGGVLPNQIIAVASVVSQNLGIQVEPEALANFPAFYTAIGYLGGQPHQNFSGLSLYFNVVQPDNASAIVNQLPPGRQANFAEFNNPRINALAAEIARGVGLQREKEISRAVFIEEQRDFRRIVLPTPARFPVYSARLRNVYQDSRAGEAFHQGGQLVELIWLAR